MPPSRIANVVSVWFKPHPVNEAEKNAGHANHIHKQPCTARQASLRAQPLTNIYKPTKTNPKLQQCHATTLLQSDVLQKPLTKSSSPPSHTA